MPKPIFALCVAVSVIIATTGIMSSKTLSLSLFEKDKCVSMAEQMTIICPPTVTISVPSNSCTVFVNIPPPTSNDPLCPITVLSNDLTGMNDPSGEYSPQSFVIVWTIMDACGNSMNCNQVVSITDNTAPLLVCPQNIVLPCHISEAIPYSDITEFLAAGGQSSDNCQLDSPSFTFVSQVIVPQPIPIVVYSRVYRINDIYSNQATCMQSITVSDMIMPMITCPPDITTGNSDDGRNTMVIVDMPLASDNCALASVINDFNDTNDASDYYPVDTTYITWTATDTAMNTASCVMSVIVFDNTPPDLFCPSEELLSCAQDLPDPFADYFEFELAGGDAMDETLLDTSSFALLDEFSDNQTCPETITRVYVISDEAGNSGTCSQEFIIHDQIRPVIPTPPTLSDISCNFPVPSPQNLVATDNCGDVDAIGETLPYTPNLCTGYTVTFRWTAMDFCGNEADPVLASFQVLPDLLGPVITPPQNITVNTENNLCQAFVTVPLLSVTDNCSTFSIVNNYNNTSNASGIYTLGTHLVVWTVTDVCNNVSTVEQAITVVDNQGPNLICKGDLVVALNDYLNDLVPASEFIESVEDNCGGNITLEARRMEVSCGLPNSNMFSPNVPFCCNDVTLTDIMVQIRATDQRNISTTCMVPVDVQDNIAPTILHPLPDITISCEFPLNLNNLSVFGTYVAQGEPRQDIIINDYFYLPSGYAGMDGVYMDNCPDITISVTTTNNLVMCNTGTLLRHFTFEDAMGNEVSTTQTITVVDVNPFNLLDITWPNEQTYFNYCNILIPPPDSTGRPVLANDKCSMAAATYSDLNFPNNAYCKVVKRTWTVIDWCHYVPNTSIGRWTFDQYIYVTNDVPPTIDSDVCQTISVCTPNGSCTGQLNLQASGTDDCLPVQITWSFQIDENNDQSIEQTGTGANINRAVPRGIHRIIWQAKDKCGNITSCEKLVTVMECKAPTGIVHHGLALNLSAPMGMATIFAHQFNNGSSDNCTPTAQLKYSFSTNINDISKTFDCSHVGEQPIQIWVTDLEGNQSIINTKLDVQDNDNVCTSLHKIVIAGNVKTVDEKELKEVKIMIEGGETFEEQMTNDEGKFCFQNLGMFNDYRLTGERTKEPLRGVSTLDLVLIQRHILGIETFDMPEIYLAGDVDGSGKINSVDLVALRKLILGSVDSFPNQKPWVFVKEDQLYHDPKNPWIESLDFQFQNIDSSLLHTNFIGIKVGDVNLSYSKDLLDNNLEYRNNSLPEFMIEDIVMKTGEITPVAITAKNMNGIISQQFTLELLNGMEYVGFESKDLPLQTDQIALIQKEGRTFITCAYHQLEPLTLEDGAILFHLLLRPKAESRLSKLLILSNEVTPSKVYFENRDHFGINLQYTSLKKPDIELVKQNHPNPFKDQTTIEWILTEKTPIQVTIFDGSGKMIHKEILEGQMGINSLTLGQKELGEVRGILYVKLKSNSLNEVVRIMRIE
ncbi:MAG: HYR domain-containing protein [Saprospiraceae bacterium]